MIHPWDCEQATGVGWPYLRKAALLIQSCGTWCVYRALALSFIHCLVDACFIQSSIEHLVAPLVIPLNRPLFTCQLQCLLSQCRHIWQQILADPDHWFAVTGIGECLLSVDLCTVTSLTTLDPIWHKLTLGRWKSILLFTETHALLRRTRRSCFLIRKISLLTANTSMLSLWYWDITEWQSA